MEIGTIKEIGDRPPEPLVIPQEPLPKPEPIRIPEPQKETEKVG